MVVIDDVGSVAVRVVVKPLSFITASCSVFAPAVRLFSEPQHRGFEQKHIVRSAGNYKPDATAARPCHRARGGGAGTHHSPCGNESSLGFVGDDSCRRQFWCCLCVSAEKAWAHWSRPSES